jgi:hypothetical protein
LPRAELCVVESGEHGQGGEKIHAGGSCTCDHLATGVPSPRQGEYEIQHHLFSQILSLNVGVGFHLRPQQSNRVNSLTARVECVKTLLELREVGFGMQESGGAAVVPLLNSCVRMLTSTVG